MGARARWVLVGVVLLLAVALGWTAVSWVSGGTSEPESAPTDVVPSECPEEMPTDKEGITVPDGGASAEPGQLVPDGSPAAVTVCRYASDEPSGGEPQRLIASKELTGDLDRVVDELREVPQQTKTEQVSCMMRSPRTPYLLVVDHDESSAWVAAEYTSECDYASRYTTNGTEVFERIGQELHEAHADGRWPEG